MVLKCVHVPYPPSLADTTRINELSQIKSIHENHDRNDSGLCNGEQISRVSIVQIQMFSQVLGNTSANSWLLSITFNMNPLFLPDFNLLFLLSLT